MSYIKMTQQFAYIYVQMQFKIICNLKIGYEFKSQWGRQRRSWKWRGKGGNDINIVIMY